MNAGSGLVLPPPFARYDPATSSLKTCQGSLQLAEGRASAKCSPTWPRSGTMRNGRCFPAAAVGAPHRRDRLWIVAYSTGIPAGEPHDEANTEPIGRQTRALSGIGSGSVGDALLIDPQGQRPGGQQEPPTPIESGVFERTSRIFLPISRSDYWRDSVLVRGRPVKPGLCVLAHGVPRRVAKLRALGNAVVPQVAEHVGRCVMAHAEGQP
jgi:DNA (cytosine-5)-methyltransferase 1